MKIIDIFKAYKNLITPTPEQEILAEKRLKICEKCPSRDEHLNICKDCLCWIPAKVFADNPNACPLKAKDKGGWEE